LWAVGFLTSAKERCERGGVHACALSRPDLHWLEINGARRRWRVRWRHSKMRARVCGLCTGRRVQMRRAFTDHPPTLSSSTVNDRRWSTTATEHRKATHGAGRSVR